MYTFGDELIFEFLGMLLYILPECGILLRHLEGVGGVLQGIESCLYWDDTRVL